MPSPLGGAGLLSVHSLTAQLPMGELWDQGWGTSALLEFFSLKAPCELCVPASLWGHSHGALLQKGKDLARDMPSQEGACCTAGWPRMGWEVRIYGCALLHLWTALVDYPSTSCQQQHPESHYVAMSERPTHTEGLFRKCLMFSPQQCW